MKILALFMIFTIFFNGLDAVEIIRGYRNLTEYYKGNTNLIISVPHNGLVDPSDLPGMFNCRYFSLLLICTIFTMYLWQDIVYHVQYIILLY